MGAASIEDQKQVIWNFIKKHSLCALTTVNAKGNPEAAVIEFSEREPFELIFDTFVMYRKYGNIQKNQNVAVVIGWDENITVQYEGIAVELNGKELKECQKIHIAKLPDSAKFMGMAGVVYFKVIPKWIRYSDLTVFPWRIFELPF